MLALELHYRRRAGQRPCAEEYLARFAEFATVIAAACPAEQPLANLLVHEAQTSPNRSESASSGTLQVPGYEIVRELDRGGMGVVYLAQQLGFDRLVAVKLIRSGGSDTAAVVVRFHTELRAIARLNHPGIVQVYDSGECPDTVPYLAMEYCPGGSLAGKLRQNPLPHTEAAVLVERIARAVQVAHDCGIIHRDLKPGNILLDGEGLPKVADFGLARLVDVGGDTVSGQVLGTPAYMAPEQAAGHATQITTVSDVYALGAILYECLTGQPPFKAPTVLEVLDQVRHKEPVPVRQLQPNTPRDLETITLNCLRKEAGKRYQSATELAEDLAAFRECRPIRARPVGRMERAWRWCRRHRALAALWAVSVLAGLGLLGLGFWFSVRIGAAQGELVAERAERGRQEAVAEAQAREAMQARKQADISNYYRLLNQVRERNQLRSPGWTQQGLKDLTTAAPLLPGPEDLPELRSVAVACLGGVTLREKKKLAVGTPVYSIAFSPDGRSVILGRNLTWGLASCSMLVVDVESGKTVRNLSFSGSAAWQLRKNARDGVRSMALSPDGRWLVAGMRSGWLHRWDLRQKTPAPTSKEGHTGTVEGLTFSRNGKALYSLTKEGILKRWDIEAWKETASFRGVDLYAPICSPAADWVACLGHGGLCYLDGTSLGPLRPTLDLGGGTLTISPDGRCLFVGNGRSLRMFDLVTTEMVAQFRLPGQEVAHQARITDLAVSPDGTLLVSASESTSHVRLWDVANATLLADVYVGGGSTRLAFAPDGRTLAVAGEKETLLYDVGGWGRTTLAVQPRSVLDAVWLRGEPTLSCLAQSVVRHSHEFGELTFWPVSESGRSPAVTRSGISLPLGEGFQERAGLAFGPSGESVVWADQHEARLIWPPAQHLRTLNWLGLPKIEVMQFGPDSRFWTGAKTEVQARIGEHQATWSNELSNKLTGKGQVQSLRVGRREVAVGIRDGSVVFLRAADAKATGSQQLGKGSVQTIDFDPAERLAAVGTERGAVGLLRLPDGEPLFIRDAHRDSVESIAFLGTDLVATGSNDHVVRLWRVSASRLEEVLTFSFNGPIQRVAATADEARLLVLVKGERAVRLWRLDQLHRELTDLGIDPGFKMPVPVFPPVNLKAWLPPELPHQPRNGLVASTYDGQHFERVVQQQVAS